METEEERQAFRQQIAAKQNAAVEAARELLGPAKAYGVYVLRDTTGVEEDQRVYCCRKEGMIGWQPSPEDAFGKDKLYERRTDKWIDVKGERCYFQRYQLWCGAMEEYHPINPEVLRKRNETRKANKAKKQLAADKSAMPLLAS